MLFSIFDVITAILVYINAVTKSTHKLYGLYKRKIIVILHHKTGSFFRGPSSERV